MKTLSSIQKNREEELRENNYYQDKPVMSIDDHVSLGKQTTLALLEGMVSMVKERQRGWYGSEEDGSDRHPNFDEDQYFLDYLQEQITEIKK